MTTANPSHLDPAADARLRALIENNADSIVVVDVAGNIIYDSPNRDRCLGDAIGELEGQNAFALIHPDDRPTAELLFGELLKNPGQSHTAEFRLRHKDGSWRTVEVVGRNLLDNPAIAGIVLNSRDITARKQMEQELRLRLAELQSANEQLRAFNRLAVGRELRMIDLKKEINELCVAAGHARRYDIEFDQAPQ